MYKSQEIFVSVVMAVYNGDKFLKATLDSILNQTYKNFELVIIDDGSDDNSVALIEELQLKDNRIRLYRQENAGVAAALNKGLQMAKSSVIVRIDADDIMLPERLERQVPFFLSHPEATIVSCYSYHIGGNGKRIGKSGNYSYILSVQRSKEHVKKGGNIYCLHSGVIYWREPILQAGGYNEKLPVSEDTELWNRMADLGYYTIVMPERLVEYRIHKGSLTSSWLKHVNYREWVSMNIGNRRDGAKEISYEEFLVVKSKESRLTRYNKIRKAYGALAERTSEILYGEGKYLLFIFYCLACVGLRPRLTFYRLKNHFSSI